MNMKVEKLTNEKWLNLFKATWVDKKGKNRDWLFSSRKDFADGKVPDAPNSQREADAVVIVPIIRGETTKDNKLVVAREWRAPLNGYEYGFPAGLVDQGERLVDTIKRELKEETGLDLIHVSKISPVTFSSIGMTDESIVYAHVVCDGEISNEYLEETENIETFALTIEELWDLFFKTKDIHWSAKAWPYIYNFVEINHQIRF